MDNTNIIAGNRVRIVKDELADNLGKSAESLTGKVGTVDYIDDGHPYPVLVILDEDRNSGFKLPFQFDEIEVIPQTPSAPMTREVLAHLQSVGTISGQEANTLYKCRALPRRIRDLKEAGWPIKSQFKVDRTGQRYVRYELAA